MLILVVFSALPYYLGSISVVIPEAWKPYLITMAGFSRVILAGVAIYLAAKSGKFGQEYFSMNIESSKPDSSVNPPFQGIQKP